MVGVAHARADARGLLGAEREKMPRAPLIESEQRKAATLLDQDVAVALVAEENEADRTRVRALIRDKLTGMDVPFEVLGFAETMGLEQVALFP